MIHESERNPNLFFDINDFGDYGSLKEQFGEQMKSQSIVLFLALFHIIEVGRKIVMTFMKARSIKEASIIEVFDKAHKVN